ncbi:MAG: hypothetical protein ACXU8Z_01645, partial [Caulobacteraceae bacterium]
RVLGSEQLDDFKSHTHAIQVNNGTTGAGPKAQTASTSPGTAVNTDAAPTSGGAETRPRNVALTPIIKL